MQYTRVLKHVTHGPDVAHKVFFFGTRQNNFRV